MVRGGSGKMFPDRAARGYLTDPTWKGGHDKGVHICCGSRAHHRHLVKCTEEDREKFWQEEGNEKWKALGY